MKTLVLVAHPNLGKSRVNKTWKERVEQEEQITVRYLNEVYPDGKIDVKTEQELLVAHDRIVFQFPFFWFSTPPILKEWQDAVLEYGFAFGSKGTALHGKEFVIAMSLGGSQVAYETDSQKYFQVSELLRPLEAMAKFTGMNYKDPYLLYDVGNLSDERLADSTEGYVSYVLGR